jgi:hypothetical protein
MSLEHSPTRSRKKASPSVLFNDDNKVLTIRQWAALNSFSISTAHRILSRPKSERPVVTQLSAHRKGITVANNRRWQESRAR